MNTQLITQIARCCEVEKAKTDFNHPCNKIVCSQNGHGFQLPEPYNGNIEKADILFISSNPNIDKDEQYPASEWNDTEISDFFVNRFENTPKKQYSRYWKSIFKWASWIMPEIPSGEIHKHIAVTEVVHCKSKSEYGVKKCLEHCVDTWLKQVLTLFNRKYIVLVGKHAQQCYDRIKTIDDNKIIIQTPHPQRPVKGLTDAVRRRTFTEQIR